MLIRLSEASKDPRYILVPKAPSSKIFQSATYLLFSFSTYKSMEIHFRGFLLRSLATRHTHHQTLANIFSGRLTMYLRPIKFLICDCTSGHCQNLCLFLSFGTAVIYKGWASSYTPSHFIFSLIFLLLGGIQHLRFLFCSQNDVLAKS